MRVAEEEIKVEVVKRKRKVYNNNIIKVRAFVFQNIILD